MFPLSKLQRFIKTESQSYVITFSPHIVIEGNADDRAVERALGKAYQEFKAFMERYKREQARTAFA